MPHDHFYQHGGGAASFTLKKPLLPNEKFAFLSVTNSATNTAHPILVYA